jgi:hypothetical protein
MKLTALLFALCVASVTSLAQPTAPSQTAAAPLPPALAQASTQAELEKLRETITKTREELAELKPITAVTNTVFYFVAAISALLGFFGWRKFSDLDALVGEQVKLQLPRSQREYAEFEEITKNAEELHKKLLQITADYERALSNLKYVDVLGSDFDIEGKVAVAAAESSKRRKQFVAADGEQEGQSLYEPAWRSSVIALLTTIPDVIKKRNLDGDFLFNIAQLCRRMEQTEIAQQVTLAAFERLPSASNRALMLSSIVKSGDAKAAPEAFLELLEMVRNLTQDQPHIVMAEAWNAAVDLAGFRRLIDAIDSLLDAKKDDPDVFAPSYVHAIRARCLLTESKPGCITEALSTLASAKNALKSESAAARWARHTLDEIGQCERLLAQTAHMQLALSVQAPKPPAPPESLPQQASGEA